uniref:Uncharacterized protein n=1 Tax=Steinernema glaseri TaxID=37863 RepID=A0A1I7Y2T1_9BILA
MRILVIFLVTFVISQADAFEEVTTENFWSIYFSNLWKVIVNKFEEVKEFFEREVPKIVQVVKEEVPKFVEKVETDVPKFVEELHLKEEIAQKTEAIANATTKVKRYFADWDDKLRDTVDSFKAVFVVIAVVFVLALVSYLYLECKLIRKLLLAIPRMICHVVVQIVKKRRKKKANKMEKGHVTMV